MGRHTSYTEELAKEICIRLSTGETLISICKTEGYPHYATIMRWLHEKSDFQQTFREKYARAREDQADFWADEIIEVADDAKYDWTERIAKGKATIVCDHEHVHRSQLRVDARKWIASKLKPKKYSEKFIQTIESDAPVEIQATIRHGDGILLNDQNKSGISGLDPTTDTDSSEPK